MYVLRGKNRSATDTVQKGLSLWHWQPLSLVVKFWPQKGFDGERFELFKVAANELIANVWDSS